jgi:hypothetical protein
MLCKRDSNRSRDGPAAVGTSLHLHFRGDHDETNGHGFVDDRGCGHWHEHRLSLPSSPARRLRGQLRLRFQLWRMCFELWRRFQLWRLRCGGPIVRLLHGGRRRLCQSSRQCRPLAADTSAGDPNGSRAEERLIGRDSRGSDYQVGQRRSHLDVVRFQKPHRSIDSGRCRGVFLWPSHDEPDFADRRSPRRRRRMSFGDPDQGWPKRPTWALVH